MSMRSATSDSQVSVDDLNKWDARFSHKDRDPSPPRRPRGRLCSDDVRCVGGHLELADNAEKMHIDPADLGCPKDDDTSETTSCPYAQSRGHGGIPPLCDYSPTLNTPVRRGQQILGPYPPRPDFAVPDYRVRQPKSQGARTSGGRTECSEDYATARGYSASDTTIEEDPNGNGHHHRQTTPYFTPTNTPSHASEGTTEDHDHEDYDDSEDYPTPFFAERGYIAKYGEDVVMNYDNVFTGRG
ncbi:hypothetical protein CC78DRAFT_542565 [Lojkania enalia]|uniref:Uncharacterized protein n=1 Tax=Lojkania enalia TaxID=147567 RepID=A0A9P4KBP3_9PLEO|nr:hypothetical protein CC78DRAFT_542565 [Didymosphaeria enalia]